MTDEIRGDGNEDDADTGVLDPQDTLESWPRTAS